MTSCATGVTIDPEKVYKKELSITYEGRTFDGFGSLPKRDKYNILIKSRKKTDFVRITNCHRDIIMREVKTREFYYTIVPNNAVEDGSCIINIWFLNEDGGNEFGALSLTVDHETIPASVSCNGEIGTYAGASVCQAKTGTTQMVVFNKEVMAKASNGCGPINTDDYKTWKYQIKQNFCLYLFKNESEELHKHTSFGYNEIVPK